MHQLRHSALEYQGYHGVLVVMVGTKPVGFFLFVFLAISLFRITIKL